MAEPFTIYKLTILYMLSKAGFPLSNTQISNFFLEQEYTDYFRVQEVIGDLVDANLIHAESTHSNTQYSLTSAGKETLGFFQLLQMASACSFVVTQSVRSIRGLPSDRT